MTIKKQSIRAAAVVVILGLALPAFAVEIDADTAVSADGTIGVGTGTVQVDGSAGVGGEGSVVSSGSSAGAGVSGSAEAKGETNLRTGIGGIVDAILGKGGSSDEVAESDTGAAGEANVQLGAPIMVTRADVETSAVAATTLSPVSVRTEADLTGYAAAQIENDENLERVRVDGSDVTVTYRAPAKFLGFLSSSVRVSATVDAEGEVDVRYPWYAFLFASESEAALEAAIAERLDAALSAGGTLTGSVVNAQADAAAEASASAQASAAAATATTAQAKARVIEEVRAALEESFLASVQTEVSADGSGEARVE